MLPANPIEPLAPGAGAAAVASGGSSQILLPAHPAASGKLAVDSAQAQGQLASVLAGQAAAVAAPLATSSSKYPPGRQLLTEAERREQFQMFLGILLKYLGKKDPALRDRARAVIEDCQTAYARSGLQGGRSGGVVLYLRIQSRLQEIVTVKQWKRAQMYLQIHLQNRRERALQRQQQSPQSQPQQSAPRK